MNQISKHIEDLLHNHNCVIIPDFGGFITSKKESYYDEKKEMFFPSSMNVLFNKNLVFNDGLLASRIAEKQSISFDDAHKELVKFKDDCYLKLNKDGRCEIERVGVLFFDKEKNIQFQQSQKNYLLSSFGLSPKLLPKTKSMIRKETIMEKTTTIVERKIETERVNRDSPNETLLIEPRKRKVFKVVPLLVIPMLLATAFFGNQKGIVGDSPINMASLNPFSSTTIEVYTPRNGETFLVDEYGEPISVSAVGEISDENESVDTESVSEETETTIVEEEIVAEESEVVLAEDIVEEPEVEEEIVPELIEEEVKPEAVVEEVAEVIPAKEENTFVESTNTTLKYHVIAGCFGVKENADNFVASWINKGKSSSIIDKKGKLYRVAVQSFATRNEAKSLLSELKSEGISGWVLRK